jgi:hypothetical protein
MNAEQVAPVRQVKPGHVCNLVGKVWESRVCDGCSERIRIEALARNQHEERGDAWTLWE